jgi:hypothetical protein
MREVWLWKETKKKKNMAKLSCVSDISDLNQVYKHGALVRLDVIFQIRL